MTMTEERQTSTYKYSLKTRILFLGLSVGVLAAVGIPAGTILGNTYVSDQAINGIGDGLKPVAAAAANSTAQDTASLDRSMLPVGVGVALVKAGAERCAVAFKVDSKYGMEVPQLGLRNVIVIGSDGVSGKYLTDRFLGCAEGATALSGWVDRDGFHPGLLGQK